MVEAESVLMTTKKIIEEGIEYTVITERGMQRWFVNHRFHRIHGPAIIWTTEGTEFWYRHGKLHREDGPAIIYSDGTKQWFYNGEQLEVRSLNGLKKWLKFKAFE